MKVKEYFKKYYPCVNIIENHEISDVFDNSKEVCHNSIYVYMLDNKNLKYIDEAINNGAKTIIIDNNVKYFTDKQVNIIKLNNPKGELARLLKHLYFNKYNKFPKIIGITGTTGKTTVSTLIYQTIKNNNFDVLLLSSNGNYSYYAKSEKAYKTKNTTPGLKTIYKLMLQNELMYDYVIIEVSSQGIMDGRLNGLMFDYSIITNFDCEHLEYHKSYDEYKNTKARIISMTKNSVILFNQMKEFNFFKNYNENIKITCGYENADYNIFPIVSNINENIFLINNCNCSYLFKTSLIGDFNTINISLTFALLKELKFKDSMLKRAFNNLLTIQGRVNVIEKNKRIFIVDYPHSKIALENIILFLKNNKMNRLITIIGAGGERDNKRRKEFGKLACDNSDIVIFTEDNSRSENVESIINDLIQDIKNDNYIIEYNRKKAIEIAINIAKEHDIVAILGKGNEDYIKKDVIEKHNDLEYLKEVLEAKYVE